MIGGVIPQVNWLIPSMIKLKSRCEVSTLNE